MSTTDVSRVAVRADCVFFTGPRRLITDDRHAPSTTIKHEFNRSDDVVTAAAKSVSLSVLGAQRKMMSRMMDSKATIVDVSDDKVAAQQEPTPDNGAPAGSDTTEPPQKCSVIWDAPSELPLLRPLVLPTELPWVTLTIAVFDADMYRSRVQQERIATHLP
jgi:hypothetical protein